MAAEEEIKQLKERFLEKRQEAEKAAYEYFCACDIGSEREQAFEFYERMRNATRLYA